MPSKQSKTTEMHNPFIIQPAFNKEITHTYRWKNSVQRSLATLHAEWHARSLISYVPPAETKLSRSCDTPHRFPASSWVSDYVGYVTVGTRQRECNIMLSDHFHSTHCGRVTQICVFNTVKLGTSASSP